MLILLAAGGAGAAILLIGQFAHYADLLKRLRGASPGWLAVCAVGEILAYVGFTISYQAMAQVSGGPRMPMRVAVRVVGLSFGAFSLATTAGGLTVDFWALHEAGEPLARAAARVIALETLRWAVLGVATCVAAVVVLTGLAPGPSWPAPLAWLVVVPACFCAGLWVSAAGRRERLTQPSDGRVRRALGIAVAALVYVRELITGPRGLRRRAISSSALYWAGDLLCAWAALRAFGPSIGLAPLLLGYATGNVAEALPLPGGGSGGMEAALTGGFALAGAPLSVALLGAVTFRIFNFWLPAIVALLSVITIRGLRGRLREIAAQRGDVAEQRAEGRPAAAQAAARPRRGG